MPESGAYDARVYEQALSYVRRMVAEIERVGGRPPEPSPEALEPQTAFMADRLSLFQWLQYVLAPRVEQIVREGGASRHRARWGRTRRANGMDTGKPRRWYRC